MILNIKISSKIHVRASFGINFFEMKHPNINFVFRKVPEEVRATGKKSAKIFLFTFKHCKLPKTYSGVHAKPEGREESFLRNFY